VGDVSDDVAPERHELPHGDPEFVVETARGIVTNELMIVDIERHEWQISLALMMNKLAEISNLGLILVPRGPHIGLHWINNTAPGCTLSCQLVASQDIEALTNECARMYAALHPLLPPEANMTTPTNITFNGIKLDPGIIVDGDIHGQYAEDHLAEFAAAYNIELHDDIDPRVWRARASESEENDDGMAGNHRESMDEATTKLIETMNEHTEGGSFEWEDGSVFLTVDGDDDAGED
jgi:hypothetical protein